MKTKFTFREFQKKYSDDDLCLKEIFQRRFGNLECCPACAVADAKFYRMKKRKCFECGECGHQIYPLAGTVMQHTLIPLTLWFYAIFLFSNCKNGVSAKELERQLGLCYKSAWKLGHKIRQLMNEEGEFSLSGIVEVDESLYGGWRRGKRGWGAANKTCVFGMVEKGGRVMTKVVTQRRRAVLFPIIVENVETGTHIQSDEFRVYVKLPDFGYGHSTVVHSRYQWRNGDTDTNSIEGFWGNTKKFILGTHTAVSSKHLQSYLNEFGFKYNRRNEGSVFDELLTRATS